MLCFTEQLHVHTCFFPHWMLIPWKVYWKCRFWKPTVIPGFPLQHTWEIKLVDNYCVPPWNKHDWNPESVIPSHLIPSNNINLNVLWVKPAQEYDQLFNLLVNICGTFGTSQLFCVVWNFCHQETPWRSSFGPELFLLGQTHEYSEESIKWRLC